MIIGIEGTGSQDWDNTLLRRSFVRKILEQSTEKQKTYYIGPNDAGTDGKRIIDGAWVNMLDTMTNKEKLILVGYSRGAAYCMKIAEWLASYRRVDFLIMFDAVARNDYSDSAAARAKAWYDGGSSIKIPVKVPATVDICAHAVRSWKAGSRAGFGNVGLEVEAPGRTQFFLRQDFFCSHGAMGGTSYDAQAEEGITKRTGYAVSSNTLLNNLFPSDPRYRGPEHPVTDQTRDDRGMLQVGNWMWKKLHAWQLIRDNGDYAPWAAPFRGKGTPGVAYPVK